MSEKILIIDDDIDIGQLLSKFLEKHNYQSSYSSNGKKGINLLKKEKYDLVLCDFRLPDMDGVEAIQQLREVQAGIKIIIITGYSDVKTAVQCMKSGASEYVTKPIYPEEILMTVKKVLKEKRPKEVASSHAKSKKTEVKDSSKKEYISGESNQARKLEQQINLLAPTDMSIIIQGESGTGKEMMANKIHQLSKRKNKPFVAIDCGALPKELATSELFGHLKGSFTGAVKDKTGHFEMADGGTLFLDEVGNLSYENQVKLLRVLQERKIKKLGDTKDVDVNIRLIAASNEIPETLVEEGKFREDLFYRLNEFTIDIPPLRERKNDILLFAYHFLKIANSELDRQVDQIDEEVENILQSHHWPGNLRELKNVIKRGVLLSEGSVLKKKVFPLELQQPKIITENEDDQNEEITDLKAVAEKAEKKAIIKVLEHTGYNKTNTAKILKIDRKTLYNKLESYNITLQRTYK